MTSILLAGNQPFSLSLSLLSLSLSVCLSVSLSLLAVLRFEFRASTLPLEPCPSKRFLKRERVHVQQGVGVHAYNPTTWGRGG
jgi:hypothetical protein